MFQFIPAKYTVAISFVIYTIFSALAQDNIFPTHFDTKAKYAYLMDYDSGEVLFDKNGNVTMAPSSMTKIMTTYIIFDKLKNGGLKLSDKFIVSENASKKDGSKMFIAPKQQITVDELLNGVIVLSGNDACVVLSEGLYGSESAFVERMNAEAKKMGLTNSEFKNSTGWPDEGHLMSARDLAILSSELIKNFPEYYNYHSTKKYSFNNITQNNRNTLLGLGGVDGIKTGKTDVAGYGIVVSAKRDGRRLIAVINGLETEKERIEEAEKILNYGFINFKNLQLFSGQREVVEANVIYGNVDKIPLNVSDEVTITVPAEYDRIKDLVFTTEFQEPLEAPLKKGTPSGTLKIMSSKDKILVKEVDLVIGEDVEQAGILKRTFQKIKYFFIKKFS
jgi:D-alanyl-D-alanine carboxypeptidase (penicillin-binding protein 5/6)